MLVLNEIPIPAKTQAKCFTAPFLLLLPWVDPALLPYLGLRPPDAKEATTESEVGISPRPLKDREQGGQASAHTETELPIQAGPGPHGDHR